MNTATRQKICNLIEKEGLVFSFLFFTIQQLHFLNAGYPFYIIFPVEEFYFCWSTIPLNNDIYDQKLPRYRYNNKMIYLLQNFLDTKYDCLQASLLYKSENILAEGPYWHAGRQSFFWVDIDGKKFHEYEWNGGKTREWQLDRRVSMIAEFGKEDSVILAVQGGLAAFDLQSGKFEWLLDIEREMPMNRTNDGGCDPAGRLWIGTMHREFEKGKGSLYSVEHDLSFNKRLDNITVSNGIVWSQDGRRMYFIDSPTQTVQSFLFNIETGDLQFEKIAISINKKIGTPDGACMDEEGMLWIAQWNGFGVYRWNPVTGMMLDKIDLPVPQVSSCAFGGENMDHLLITTARENMSNDDLKEYPLSGNVFIAKPGINGIRVHKFGKQKVT